MNLTDATYDLCLKRGFFYPSFELYGGASGFYDYGPLGAALKRRIEHMWRRVWVQGEGFFEIDSATVGVEEIFRASGHLGAFEDPTTDCQQCGLSFRADHLVKEMAQVKNDASYAELTEAIRASAVKCPECGGALGDVYGFNLMFRTTIGPGGGRTGYLRPETAQGMFYAFPRLLRAAREGLPFGVAQVGRAYRNEISPRQGMMRMREFNQMEVELFVHPEEKRHPRFAEVADLKVPLLPAALQKDAGGEATPTRLGDAVARGLIAHELLAYCVARTYQFLLSVGVDAERLRFRQHLGKEMAHYAADCWDAEAYLERYGWVELVGVADRTDYDLKAHAKASGEDLCVLIPYAEPRKVRRRLVVADMGRLGPLFKGDAPRVAAALEALNPSDAGGKGPLTVAVDGRRVEVPRDAVSVEERDVVDVGERVTPHVIEPSFGCDRILFSAIEHCLREDVVDGEPRTVLSLPDAVAPFDAAVLPLLSNRPQLVEVAREILAALRGAGLAVDYDDSGSIGRRYRRHDEVGTPLCVTVDLEGLEAPRGEWTVTLRDRDFMQQRRVRIPELVEVVPELLAGRRKMGEVGTPHVPRGEAGRASGE